MPVRIQRKRTRGWKMPENTVSVTRPGKWGNPFKVGEPVWNPNQRTPSLVVPRDIEHCLELYREYMKGAEIEGTWMNEDIKELKGKNLACWCREGEPCHADILLFIANK